MTTSEGMLEELRRKKAEKASGKKATPAAAPATAETAIGKARAAIAAGTLKFDGDQVFAKEGADNGWLMRPATPAELVARDTKPEATPVAPPKEVVSAPTTSISPPDAPSRTVAKTEAADAPTPEPEAPKAKVEKQAKLTGRDVAAAVAKGMQGAGIKVTILDQPPTIYVGCLPARTVALFADWVRPIEDAVAAKMKLAHWKGAQFIAHAEAAMVVAIREALPTLPTQIFVEGEEPAAKLFLATVTGADVIRKCF